MCVSALLTGYCCCCPESNHLKWGRGFSAGWSMLIEYTVHLNQLRIRGGGWKWMKILPTFLMVVCSIFCSGGRHGAIKWIQHHQSSRVQGLTRGQKNSQNPLSMRNPIHYFKHFYNFPMRIFMNADYNTTVWWSGFLQGTLLCLEEDQSITVKTSEGSASTFNPWY